MKPKRKRPTDTQRLNYLLNRCVTYADYGSGSTRILYRRDIDLMMPLRVRK